MHGCKLKLRVLRVRVKMRKDHPTGAINFNGKTGEISVFGEATEVNKVCDEIASITLMANKTRAKENARKERVGKASLKEKNHKYEKDLNFFQKAGSLKSEQKQNAYGEMTTAEVKIDERAALGNKKAKKKMKKRKELQKKKMI